MCLIVQRADAFGDDIPLKKMHFLMVLAFVLTLVGCDDLSGQKDLMSSRYRSFEKASEDGAFESGWLPRTLPRSAWDILEVHNLDTNEIWIVFRYRDNSIEELTNACIARQEVRFPDAKRAKRDVGWWPVELTGRGKELDSKKWATYLCPEMRHAESKVSATIAVDVLNQTAWYWVMR